MNWYKCLIILCTFCLLQMAGSAYAQNLTDEQVLQIESRAKQAVEEFQTYLSNLSNTELRKDIREKNLEALLDLFIAKGDSYGYYDENSFQHVKSSGVKVQIFDGVHFKSSMKLKNFLHRIYNPRTGMSTLPFSSISLEDVNVIRLEEIQKVDSHYECIAIYLQKFVGFRDGHPVYSDRTLKRIKLYLEAAPAITLPSNGKNWTIKLGDIYIKKNSNEKI